MKLTFIGAGSAFTIGAGNYQSNLLLENDAKEKLLIDCGSDARLALHDLGLSYKDICHIYISHLHADHVGGLEWLGFTHKFDPSCDKPVLYISEKLVKLLWNNVLAGGLSSLEEKKANLSTYFEVMRIKKSFTWQKLKINLIPTIHAASDHKLVPCYGLIFKTNGFTVLITADSRFNYQHFHNYYKKADIIFHDCETQERKSGIHASYKDLMTLDNSIKKKMWLYHYNPGTLPNAKNDGFRGFVRRGQVFDFKNPKTLL